MILIKLLWILLFLTWDVFTTVAQQDVENLTLDSGTMQIPYQRENGVKETMSCPRYFATLPPTSVEAEIKYKLENNRWSDRVILDLLYYGLQGGVNASSGTTQNKQQLKWDILQRSEKSHCRWEGIECNSKHQVRGIDLPDLDLTGTLTPTLYQMASHLQFFRVPNNKIHGTLPGSYGSLSKMTRFNIENNELSGTIPEGYRGMESVESFLLSGNSFNGTIPNRMVREWKLLMHFDLSRNRFEGPVPYGLFENKMQLVNISLSHNQLTGSIPVVSQKMDDMLVLDLSNNMLTGTLVRLEKSMRYLAALYIRSNRLTGTIPTEIFLLSKLQTLALGDNLLEGTLPRGDDEVNRLEAMPTGGKWGDMKSLRKLDLEYNQLSGTIPIQLCVGLAPKLTSLELGHNHLEGKLPTHFGIMHRLRYLFVEYNNLEGTVPKEIANTNKLLKFNFTENHFTMIPDELCGRDKVTKDVIYFYLMSGCNLAMCEEGTFTINGRTDMYSGCQFCNGLTGPEKHYIGRATCPTANFTYGDQDMSGKLSEMEMLRLFHAGVGGMHWGKKYEDWGIATGDPCILPGITCVDGHITKIEVLDIPMCTDYVRNPLPNEDCRGIPSELMLLTHLEVLNLGKQVFLRGSIPWEIGQLTNLKHLEITNAVGMRGTLPTEVGLLTNLKVLNLSGCKYNGTIPEEIYQLTNLEKLHLNMNSFTGPISSNISNMTSLKEFMMSRAYLSSSIPEELGQLTTIENLELYGNHLTGSIPASIGNCTRLKRMDLFNNKLTGTLPDSLSKLQSLQILHLKLNQLSGTISPHFGELPFLSWFDVSSNRLQGTIPQTFGTSRNLLDFRVGNNRIYAPIPKSLCRNVNINGGLTTTYGCDGVICPLGSYSDTGHAMEANENGCIPCPEGQTTMYLGASKCEVITDHDILTMFYDVLLHDLDRKEQKLLSSEMGGGIYKESMINRSGEEEEEANNSGQERHSESSHWSWKDPSTGVCEWKGVKCDPKGEILSFRFPTPYLD